MKYIISILSLLLVGCSINYPVYSTPKPYTGSVVNWSPNPDINGFNMEYEGCYVYGNYYVPLGSDQPCGPKGWNKGFDYPYSN
jgi:hypothetical protein